MVRRSAASRGVCVGIDFENYWVAKWAWKKPSWPTVRWFAPLFNASKRAQLPAPRPRKRKRRTRPDALGPKASAKNWLHPQPSVVRCNLERQRRLEMTPPKRAHFLFPLICFQFFCPAHPTFLDHKLVLGL